MKKAKKGFRSNSKASAGLGIKGLVFGVFGSDILEFLISKQPL